MYINQGQSYVYCSRSTYTKIGTIQRRLAWPLRKDDTQIREAFHIFYPLRPHFSTRNKSKRPVTAFTPPPDNGGATHVTKNRGAPSTYDFNFSNVAFT